MTAMKEETDPVAKQHEKTRWREVLYDFTQNTTIHALKQITEPTPFCIRRVIWVLILAFGLLLFGIQVVESIIYYLSNPVAVNIMINYNDTLRFPAVTICNQNAFRMTKASQGGEFDAIENLFSHAHLEHLSNESAARYARVLDTPISQLYMDLSHRQEDFIVSCKWEQRDCSADDFERTLTDHGVCYTFNNAANLSDGKNATQTGALWGLRLRLNIEQYEYMMGPNDGAGVRVLVHSQGDFPLVGDFGQSVPPGLHAFLGIMIVEIQDLPEPHGQCQDDVELENFEHYTQAACIRECKQRIIQQECGCSHGVLPQDVPPKFPACTLRKQFHCVDPTLNRFPEYRHVCQCPYPCTRTHFDSDITYGDMSKFDMEKILYGNLTDLKNQYAFARETAQSAKKEIVGKDKRNAEVFAKSVQEMNKILEDIPEGLERMMTAFQTNAELMKHKIWFHLKLALRKVKYAVEHDFVRGWEIVEERTFNHVATGFWEIISSFDRVLELLNTRYSGAEISQRELFWYSTDDRLYNRLTMAQRALTNLTEVNDAYATGDPLLTFRNSLDRRYDMTFIPVHLIILHPKDRTEHFEECQKQLQKYISAIEAMRACGDLVVAGNTTECTNIGVNRDKFIKAAKMVNYNLFLFRTKVLMKPVEAAEAIITDFTSGNESLWEEYVFLRGLVEVVKKDVAHFASSSWLNIKMASDKFNNYTLYSSITKASLANDLNSGQMEDNVISFQHFFQNLRSRSREIKDSCMRLRDLYIVVYKKMAGEESTMPFYTKLHEDALAYLTNPPNASQYIRHFSYLTKLSKSRIRGESKTSLLKVLNADFYNINMAETLANISQFFDTELLPAAEIESTINNLDESLGNLLKEIRKDLSTFTASTKIGYDFFRENYLNLDIYMRALSYEAITQQIAYDMTNLWSDIGGSIGLFIGASAISVFEILDIFLHTGIKMGREKHLKRKRSRNNDNDIHAMDKLNSDKTKEPSWMFSQQI